jgi:hypothetical protein
VEHDERAPSGAGDPLLEIQEAIDRLIHLAWERWGESQHVTPDDVRDALIDLRPILREIDALWLHLRQTLGR